MGKGEAERKKFLLRMPGFGTNRSSGGGRVVVSSCRHVGAVFLWFKKVLVVSTGLVGTHSSSENREQ